ncbi:MAG: LptF/LptG family permease, partial [Rikenellaceae bacterium]
ISAIVEMLFYMTSTMLPMGLPFSTLLAAIMTMGNLGGSNELLALKAAGVSLFRIMRSVIIVAIFISIISFFVINNYVPYSVEKVGNILYDIRNQRQEIEFKDGVFFNGIPNISIRVGKQDPETMLITNVLIYDTRDPRVTKTIVADSGYINLVENNRYLKILLFNGQNYEDKRDYSWFTEPALRHHTFDKQDILMELEGYSFEKSDKNLYSDVSEAKSIAELGRDIDSLSLIANLSIERVKNQLVKESIYVLDTMIIDYSDSIRRTNRSFMVNAISIDTLSVEMKERVINDASRKLENMKYESQVGHSEVSSTTVTLYRSMADWQRKLTLPVSVFIFFLIGAPLGAIIRKGGLGVPTIVAVLFFVFYYVISMSSEKMVKDGAWTPQFGMWLPSLILLPIAIFLTHQAVTDSKLLNVDAYYIFFDKYWTIAKAKYKFLDKISKIKIRKKLKK